jgi:type II secretory pathway component PulF
MVLLGLACVLFFLGFYVLPGFEEVFKSFKVSLPDATRLLLSVSLVLPALLVAFVVVVVAFPIAAFMLRKTGLDRTLLDALILPLPLIGPVFRKSLLAAWCDAVRMAVEAGLDLPAAIQLAGDATASPKLRADGLALIASLSAGQDLGIAPRGAVLPPTVVAGMSLGMQHHDLASTLKSLSDMYHQQAELRLNALPGILTPILVIGVAVLIGFVVVALVTPLISLIGAVSGK